MKSQVFQYLWIASRNYYRVYFPFIEGRTRDELPLEYNSSGTEYLLEVPKKYLTES